MILDERGLRRRRATPAVVCPGHTVNSRVTVIYFR